MARRGKNESALDLKFLLFLVCGAMAGYLLFQDRSVALGAVWNPLLWLLAGPFIFGVIYQLEFFAISFWLLVALLGTDMVLGLNLSLTGSSSWSGFAVWIFILLAGFAGSLVSLLIPLDYLLPEGLSRKN
jgi:hypothetical protein